MTSNPFDLILINTWGPFQVPTFEEYRYFLTLVDDHTRTTWVYLMQSKSDALKVFPSFYNFILTQFGTPIKGVRSDNAPKLTFNNYFNSKGIMSFHSCVKTEQNSVVERKHQQLLSVARALSFQSSVPPQFWGDYIQAAVHIINCPLLYCQTKLLSNYFTKETRLLSSQSFWLPLPCFNFSTSQIQI